MSRLIDADRLIKNQFKNDISYKAFVNLVKRQQTVDAVPVVHGHWIEIGIPDVAGNRHYSCSCCDAGEDHYPTVTVPYCWRCGAKMDEVTHE